MHLTFKTAKIAFATAILLACAPALAKTNAHAHPSKTQAQKPKPKSTPKFIKAGKKAKPTVAKKVQHKKVQHKKLPPTYKSTERVHLSAKDMACLTRNVYYESRGEPYAGRLAIAQVTGTRVEARQWGRSICNVVYAPIQFSWTSDPSKRYKSLRNAEWLSSERIVQDYAQGIRVKGLENATHFHAVSLGRPSWTRRLKPVMTVGNHVFYDD